jgi:peptide/nickel transport system substrate-binding protein
MKKRKKLLAVLLAGTMTAGLVTGCGSSTDTTTSESSATNETASSTSGETSSDTTASTTGSDTPLVIANDAMNEKFSPFFGESVPDENVWLLTTVSLLDTDRQGEIVYKGIEGETREYNGTDYTYYGIADCEVTENEDGTVYYDFTIRDDVKFADGELLTIDDVIFSYYVFLDPSYDGSSSVYSLPIQGLDEYRNGSAVLYDLMLQNGEDNTDFTYYTEDEQKKFFETDLPAAGEAFAESIAEYCIANGYVEEGLSDVANGMVNWGFGEANEDGSITGASGEVYTDPTYADYWFELETAYDKDYATLSDTEAAESSLFSFLDDSYKVTVDTGESAPNISGIIKTGDNSVRVILTEVSAPAIYNLAIYVTPLHYYGDESLYDYDNNMFGFPKGDLSTVRAKTTSPMGAGPYTFVKYENKTAYLEANEYYYLGAPATKSIQWKETSDADKIPGVVQGTVDIAEPSISKAAVEQIKGENSNGELVGDVIGVDLVDYQGYGYIGMNSQLMCVGDDNASEASKNFRKAIATIIAVYRDVVIDSYYGDAASVINYPISNTSWAAPQKSDADYKVAFSVDVDGNDIYTDSMTEDEKYEAAKQAALGFFEAAGYTIEDGKITAAPEGGRLDCTLVIGGGGTGDHPSFGIVTAAAEALKSIGFDMEINDLSDTSQLWSGLNAGTVDIWCAAWSTTPDPDMFQIYHSEGGSATHYRIYQQELDDLVMEARTSTDQTYRKAVYKEALDYVVDFTVEIPIYQRQEGTVYSTQRIDTNTWITDPTSFYKYRAELATIAVK